MRRIANLITTAIAAVATISPFIIFFALPVFDNGVYRQVETVAVALHALAAISLLLMTMLSALAPDAIRRSAPAPVLAMAGVAIAGLLTIGFADEWARSLHGTLEHGVGILWHVETAVLMAAFLIAWRDAPRWRVPMAVSPAIAVILCGALQIAKRSWNADELFVVYDFPEYLGVNALLAAAPLFALRRRFFTISGATLVVGGALIAGNRTAALAALAALGLVLLAKRYTDEQRWRRAVTVLAIGMPIIVLGAIPFAAPILEKVAVATNHASNDEIASQNPLDHANLGEKFYGTVWQRSITARMVWSELFNHPSELMTGKGFGAFDEIAQVHKREAPGRRMVNATPTAASTYWDGDQKAKFHSHNMILEMLLSTGILGAVAWVALLACIARLVARKNAASGATLIAALAVGGSLWFFVNSTGPLIALAFAAASDPEPQPDGPILRANPMDRNFGDVGVTLACSLLAVVFAAASAFAYAGSVGERRERAFAPLAPIPISSDCSEFHALTMPSRDTNTSLYRIYVHRVESEARTDQINATADTAVRATNIINFSCLTRKYADNGDILAMLASLELRARLISAFNGENEILAYSLQRETGSWKDDLTTLLDKAPGRTDMIIPYVTWLNPSHKPEEVTKTVDDFLPRVGENDPVRYWLIAKKAEASKNFPAYEIAMRKSLQLGLANLLFVPTSTVRAFMGESK